MGHDITPDPIDTDNALAVPDNGDDLDADVVNAVFEPMANSLRAHRNALTAHIAWSGDFAVAPGGSLTSFTVTVGAIASLFAEDADGNFRQGAEVPTNLGVTNVEGAPGTLGAVARWWYAYAYNTTADIDGVAVVDYAISLTPPDATRRFKGSDPTRAFLGCFCTDTTGAPFPMRKAAGRCLYRRSGITSVLGAFGANGLGAVTAATVVGRTVLDLSSRIPPHARVALLQGKCSVLASGGSCTGALNLYTAADTTGVAVSIGAAAANSGENSVNSSLAEIEVTSAQLCAYSVTEANGAAVGVIDVLGWLE